MKKLSAYCVIVGINLNLLAMPSSTFDVDAVDRAIKQSLECRTDRNPGLAVSVVKDGKVLFARGYGVIDPDPPHINVTEHTRFGIASVSKSFAATLLIKLLYENTKLTVDSPVRELLGSQFQMQDEFRSQAITFADLLAHRTAVPPNNKIRFDTNLTRETLLDRLPLLDSPHQFRVKYMYSNIMYGLVTRLAEIIGHDRWENLIQTHLYDALDMSSSSFATTIDFSQNDVAKGVENDKFGPGFLHVSPQFSKNWADLAGSGAVMSTAVDMTKWMNFHLNEGQKADGQQVMAKDHLKEVHKPRFYISTVSSKETRFPQFPVTSTENLYNSGLRSGFYRGYPRMTHTGSTLGYRAQMSLLPDQKIGVFCGFTGADNSYLYRTSLSLYLLDMALGEEPWLNGTTLCTFPEPWKKKKSSSALPKLDLGIPLKKAIAEYQGTYHNRAFGYLQITFNETMKSLVMAYGWGSWQLLPQYSENSPRDMFYGRGLGVNDVYRINPLEFLEDPKDPTAIKELKIAGFESRLPPVFMKLGPVKDGPSPGSALGTTDRAEAHDDKSGSCPPGNGTIMPMYSTFIRMLLSLVPLYMICSVTDLLK